MHTRYVQNCTRGDTNTHRNTECRLCGNGTDTIAHRLSSCREETVGGMVHDRHDETVRWVDGGAYETNKKRERDTRYDAGSRDDGGEGETTIPA